MNVPRLYVIGDSISIQYGPYLQQYLKDAWIYARKEGEHEALLNLDNPIGANGGDSSRVLEFLRGMGGRIEADVMLINCGLHDIKISNATGRQQVPLEAYGANLRAIIALVRNTGIRPVWARTTPVDDATHNNRPNMDFKRFAADVKSYNALADDIMAALDVPPIDLFVFTRNIGVELFCDHVHFRENIRTLQAAYIAGWLIAYWRSLGNEALNGGDRPAPRY